jgi:hypothetical protein
MDMEQPPGHAGLGGMQRIAGGHVLELRQQRPGVDLDRLSDCATVTESRMKSRWRNLQCGPGHAYDRRNRRAGGSQRCQDADRSLIPDHRGCDRLSVRHVQHEGDRPAAGKVDLFNWISGSHQHGVAFKRYSPEVRSKQIEVCRRQPS